MCKTVQKNFLITDGLQMKKTLLKWFRNHNQKDAHSFCAAVVRWCFIRWRSVASFASAQRSWALDLLMKETVECMKMHKHNWVVALQLSQITVVTASLDQNISNWNSQNAMHLLGLNYLYPGCATALYFLVVMINHVVYHMYTCASRL